MFKIPHPPMDSRIQIEQIRQGLEFKWRARPISSITRIFSSLFFVALLIIWTVGAIPAWWALFFKKFSVASIFLGFWLIFWFYAERLFIRILYELLFDLSHTERLILGDSESTYYPGSMFNSSFGRSWGPKPFKKCVIRRNHVTNIQHHKFLNRYILTVDTEKKRYEVGASLNEAERKWLTEVLELWWNG